VFARDEAGCPLGVYVVDASQPNGYRVEEEYIHLDGWQPRPFSARVTPGCSSLTNNTGTQGNAIREMNMGMVIHLYVFAATWVISITGASVKSLLKNGFDIAALPFFLLSKGLSLYCLKKTKSWFPVIVAWLFFLAFLIAAPSEKNIPIFILFSGMASLVNVCLFFIRKR